MKLKSLLLLLVLLLIGIPIHAQYNFAPLEKAFEQNKGKLSKNLVCMIYKDGTIIYEKNSGSFTSTTQEPIASCSKWLTAALVMTFVDEGKLSLEDKVSTYLPSFLVAGKKDITIRDCLSQQTGIHQEPIKLLKLMLQKKYKTLEDEVNDFAKREQDYPHGNHFFYGNVGLNTAARVVEVIGKKDFSTMIKERIFVPLEMFQTNFGGNTKAANPSGGAISTAQDYLNFLSMLLNKGIFKNKQILSEKAVSTMQEIQTIDSKIEYAPKSAEGYPYALGSWVEEKDGTNKALVLGCPGLFGTWPLIDFKRGYACIFFVKSILGEQKADAYSSIKKSIDSVLENAKQ